MAAVVSPSPSKFHARNTRSTPLIPAGRDERYVAGKALRRRVARELHGDWTPARNRRDPVELLIQSSEGRIPELIPIRYGRMMISPFIFYRGTANIMALDLAPAPVSGLQAQLWGDAHLMNFGCFATPERRLILDINVDETLPGPWEWDVKRLATSIVFAVCSNGLSAADQREAALACVLSYREHMAEYGDIDMSVLEIWYARLQLSDTLWSFHDKTARGFLKKHIQKAQVPTVREHKFSVVAKSHGDAYVIKDLPPLIFHHPHIDASRVNLEHGSDLYRQSLPAERRMQLDRYRLMDFALKVVGAGSVGTLCAVALLMAAKDDPLFLQIKEAGPSVFGDLSWHEHLR